LLANEQGCVVETPARIESPPGTVVADCEQRYLRLKVRNRGRSFARNVALCVTRISYTAVGAGTTDFFRVDQIYESMPSSRKIENRVPAQTYP